MIVKRNFNPVKVWGYIKGPATFSIIWAVTSWSLFYFGKQNWIALNLTIAGILGSALAIFIAFRNNSSYGRWWEARTAWSNIMGSARILGRLIITFTDSHAHQQNYDRERSENFKKEMIKKVIAWAHSLKIQLRGGKDFSDIAGYFPSDEAEQIMKSDNKPLFIMMLMGRRIYRAMADGTLGGFDSFQMEGQLLTLSNMQATCERIKSTPLPRQYDFFTRMFVILYIFLLPPALLSIYNSPAYHYLSWSAVPLSVIISSVFIIMERTGAANEDPFENQVTDVPMTYICNTIERDMLEMAGIEERPAKVKAENGYLH